MLTKEQVMQTVLGNYENISALLRTYSKAELMDVVAQCFNIPAAKLEQLPMDVYSKGRTSGAYGFVMEDMQRNIDRYDWLYMRLADDISREVFTNLIRYRVLPDMRFIKAAYDGVNPQYFDKSIVRCDENEVFVDCGGFIGDTAQKYIEEYGAYKRIYVYEPSSDNIEKCRDNLQHFSNIEIRHAGVGEKSSTMAIDDSGASSSFVSAEAGNRQMEIISLDDDIREPVTFIKMDVEGFEIPAILGAKNHIRNDHPKLAICTYHIISDIWEIPQLIHMIRPDYRYYMRHYWEDQNWESVLYAIPVKEQKPEPKKIHRVVAMAPYERPWSNVELVKDCGLIPYLMHKNYGCDVSMVGAGGGEYPYAELVKGMKLEFLEDGRVETKAQYIIDHGKEIDCLILRGMYPSNYGIAQLYKTVNPEGRTYMGLDANSDWTDRMRWYKEEFVGFLDSCDVIATSCTAMAEHLSEKWPWKVRCAPNGYYNIFGETKEDVSFAQKKNRILTVGRLGTMQKATEVLLEAFAKIAERVPDWDVHLVGSIEKDFEEYKQSFFEKNPHLRERVVFTGPIQDRALLRKEYQEAKIFALPSTWEGGTPNVVAEALYGGCVIAITEIDAYEDAIGKGVCGRSSSVDDVDGFAGILLELCMAKDLDAMSEKALAHGKEFYDMEKIVEDLYEQLCV